MSLSSVLGLTVAALILTAPLAQANGFYFPGKHGHFGGKHGPGVSRSTPGPAVGRPGMSRSTPGPVIGIGLPAAIAGAAFIWARRRSKGR